MTQPVEIVLSEDLYIVARDIAAARNYPKQAAGVRSKKWAPNRSEMEVDLIGACGEVAVATYLRVEPDTFASLHGDDGTDLILPNGRTIQVKCRTRVGYDFALPSADPKTFSADVGALVYILGGSLRHLLFRGVISKRTFLVKYRIRDYGYGLRAFVSPSEMSHPSVLLDWLGRSIAK